MSGPLVIADCRADCCWRPTGARRSGERLFACDGCGSEWVPSQPWAPVDLDGQVPAEVAEARAARGRG